MRLIFRIEILRVFGAVKSLHRNCDNAAFRNKSGACIVVLHLYPEYFHDFLYVIGNTGRSS